MSMRRIAWMNVGLESMGIILSLAIITFTLFGVPQKTKQEKAFITLLACNILVLTSDALAWLFKGQLGTVQVYIVHIANFLVYALSYLLMVACTYYLHCVIAARGAPITRKGLYLVMGIAQVALIMLLIAEHCDLYYYIDEFNIYRRQSLFWLSQAFGMLGMLVNAGMLLKFRNYLNRKTLIVFSVYVFAPLITLFVQIFVYGVALTYITNNFVGICLYIFIQGEIYTEQELVLEKMRNRNLLGQIQPHFIFNTLNSISTLCLSDPQKADDAIVCFSNYLRENIHWLESDQPIAFSHELSNIQSYIKIETMRFGDRLDVVYDIRFDDFSLPPLVLQPLVENAVKHGLMKRIQGGTITLCAEKENDYAVITITDDGVGMQLARMEEGVGLKNVRQRLAFVGAAFTMKSAPGRGTQVCVKLPLKGETAK